MGLNEGAGTIGAGRGEEHRNDERLAHVGAAAPPLVHTSTSGNPACSSTGATVRDVRRGAGTGCLHVHPRDLVPARPAPAWASTTGTGGIATAIPLVTKGRAESRRLATST